MNQRTTFHADTPLQALLLAQQLQATADPAPDGQVLAHVEALAVPAARELARKAARLPCKPKPNRPKKRGAGTHL